MNIVEQIKCGKATHVCESTSVAEKMNTDPSEVVNSVTVYIKSYLTNIDEYVYRIHE